MVEYPSGGPWREGDVDDLDGRYVIVLDRWLGEYPDHWPVSAVSDSLDGARRVGGYRGRNPSPVPRSAYAARRLERKRVLDQRTGRTESGAIYRLERIGG